MEKPLETAWVGLKVGWVVVSGNHQGRAKLTRLMETQLWYLLLAVFGENSAKEQ